MTQSYRVTVEVTLDADSEQGAKEIVLKTLDTPGIDDSDVTTIESLEEEELEEDEEDEDN